MDLANSIPAARQSRSFYAAPVDEFLSADVEAVVGRLPSRHVAVHASAEAEQVRAWWRPWGRTIRLVTNPWATHPVDDGVLPVPKLLPIDGEFRPVDGEHGPGLFGLDEDWPAE